MRVAELGPPSGGPRRGRFLLGSAVAAALLLGLAEGFLRLSPPRDLHPYLGEDSPLVGICAPDPDLGITYRDWDAFRADNAERLAAHLPFHGDQGRKVWAFFGNSFVQAPGMLADCARAHVYDRDIFNLGKNEPLPLRFAQVRLLLDNGLRPERLFVLLMPVDVTGLGRQPLDTMRVTARGALTYEVRRPPGPAGWLLDHSRLALTAWARSGRHHGNPHFKPGRLYERVDAPLLADLRRLFAALARDASRHDVPVTVLLVPAYHQVTKGAPFGFQDALAPVFRGLGHDVFDPRAAFLRHPDRERLFLPDKHFNEAGNRLLLEELLRHLRGATATQARSASDGTAPSLALRACRAGVVARQARLP